jgi:hypothetical protein
MAAGSGDALPGIYCSTAKMLIGIAVGIIGVFTILLAFIGLPSAVRVPLWLSIIAIICFAAGIGFLFLVMAPRDAISGNDAGAIGDLTVQRNLADHRKLMAGTALFLIGVFLVAGSVAYNSSVPGNTVKVLATSDKVPLLEKATIRFSDSSGFSDELYLIRQDGTSYTFRTMDGSRVTVPADWVQAIVSTG